MRHGKTDELLFPMRSPVEVGNLNVSLRRGKELRVEGCVMMRIRQGSATLSINARQVEVKEGMVMYLAFDMTVISVEGSEIFVDYIALDSTVTGEIFFSVTSSALWDYIYSHPALVPERGIADYLDRLFLQGEWVQQQFPPQVSDTVLRSEVQSLFIILAAEVDRMDLKENPCKTRAWAISNDFVTLLHRHYARHHDVAYYADRLNISADYLNEICRDNIGYTAKSRIDTQIVIAIKTLLDTTDLPIKSIAERLNYDDPSYMTRVFRRITGMTPVQYRNRHHTP